jgi:phosphoesterase RecJ-like protein
MLGYVESTGKIAYLRHHGPTAPTLTFLPRVELIADNSEQNDETIPEFDLAIVLECPTLNRSGSVAKLIGPNTKIVNIDHHGDNALYGEHVWLDAEASSVCEMLAQFFAHIGFGYNSDIATALYTGILTDTGRFHYRSASSKTFAIVGDVVSHGVDVQRVCDAIYFSRRPQSIHLAGLALSKMKHAAEGRICIIPISQAMFNEADALPMDTEGIVEYTLYSENAVIGALLRETGQGGIKASLRSRGDFNVAEIAGALGGGGHKNAAGCLLHLNLQDAQDLITGKLTEALNG